MSSVNVNCQEASGLAASFRSGGSSRSINDSQEPSASHMSLTMLDSLLIPFTRPKVDAFTDEEIKLMLEEIGKRRHILLTIPRKNSREMKAAWDEVSRSVAQRSSSNVKRTSKQIKRKWRDIVAKTKKKIKEGQLKQEIQFNEITAMVTQFLASTSQEMRQDEVSETVNTDEDTSPFVTTQSDYPTSYYDQPESSTKIEELSESELINAQSTEGVQSSQRNDYYFSIPATHVEPDRAHCDVNEDSVDSDVVMIAHTSTNELSPHEDANLVANVERSQMDETLNQELLRQSREEHALRMEVLELKRRYWQIKIEALLQEKRMFSEVNESQREWK